MCHTQIRDGWAEYNKGRDAAISPQRDSLSEDSHVVRAAKPRKRRGSGKLISMLQRGQPIGKHSSSLMAKTLCCYILYESEHAHTRANARGRTQSKVATLNPAFSGLTGSGKHSSVVSANHGRSFLLFAKVSLPSRL